MSVSNNFFFFQCMIHYWFGLGIGEDVDTAVLDYSLVLPYLRPDLFEEGLQVILRILRKTAINNDKVKRFYDYVERYWFSLRDIVSLWSVPVYKNNIVEHYHAQHINSKGTHLRVWNLIGKSLSILIYKTFYHMNCNF